MSGSELAGYFLLVGCSCLLISFPFFLYASVTKLEAMEASLKECRLIVDINKRLLNSGILGRQCRLGMVCSCLLLSRIWIKKGLVDSREIGNFPLALKCWALIPMGVGVMMGLMLFVLIKFVDIP
jgi:hypothetical protein